ncbi:uncharacterized protein LOC129238039 isoform X2 [Anastrepha obliqua]|uniref:uncharacterized protein LOC129238039 isoform X2 n=1 Tax=Anastrepha obliqua TaxID=95512 RepID=UPI00240A6BC4|nr:uncharacterized protein LOC129238039 isoform X2 [Anastrepha obliqua]
MESGVLIIFARIVRHKTCASVLLLLASLASASTHFPQTKVVFTLENNYHSAQKREVHRHPWQESSHGHNHRIHVSNNAPGRGSSVAEAWRAECEEGREINGNQLSSPTYIGAVGWHPRSEGYQQRQKSSSEDDKPKVPIDERRIWDRHLTISSTEPARQTERDESAVITKINVATRNNFKTRPRDRYRSRDGIPIKNKTNGGY